MPHTCLNIIQPTGRKEYYKFVRAVRTVFWIEADHPDKGAETAQKGINKDGGDDVIDGQSSAEHDF